MADTANQVSPAVSSAVGGKAVPYVPYIVCFACNWCTYTGSDQAGRSRMQRPANVRIIRVMCSGRVEVEYAIEALKRGADGVVIGACHIGDCHYLTGNHKAVRRFAVAKDLVAQYGINPERMQFWHISASEGAEFTERIKEYVEVLKELGPSPLKALASQNYPAPNKEESL
ncbi:MAG: hydrogenase iron-sulfur subunit [Promethearchaeota archaeon]